MRTLTIILSFFLFFISNSNAQGPQQMFWALNTSNPFLLDKIVRTNASVAYSVRKLRREYSGFAVRVRRSGGGSPEGDVAFDGNGVVSANSLVTITRAGGGYSVGDEIIFSSFYSGRSVFVMTWYDQSGNNRHVTQTTASQQPRIVNSGSLEVSNSIVSVRFINSNSTFLSVSVPNTIMFSSNYIGTASMVLEASSGTTSAFGYSDGGSNRWQAHMNESNDLRFDVGTSYTRLMVNNNASVGALRTYSLIAGPSLMQVWRSGSLIASSTPSLSGSSLSTFYLGAIPPFPGAWYHNNDISELIIFPIVLNASEIGILNSDQKLFFSTP